MAAKPTNNPEAYEAYLRGRAVWNKLASGTEDYDEMVRHFSEAVKLDPQFALAWSFLSVAHSNQYWAFKSTPALAEEAKAALGEAKRLQPGLSETHFAEGMYDYKVLGDYEAALRAFAVVREISANSTAAIEFSAYVKRRQGKWDEAVRLHEESLEIDPRNPIILSEAALTYRALRRFTEAAVLVDRAREIEPEDPQLLTQRAEISLAQGDAVTAERLLKAVPIVNGDPETTMALVRFYTIERRYPEAIQALQTTLAQPEKFPAGFPALAAHYRAELALVEALAGKPTARGSLDRAQTEMTAVRREHDVTDWSRTLLLLVAAFRQDKATVDAVAAELAAHIRSDAFTASAFGKPSLRDARASGKQKPRSLFSRSRFKSPEAPASRRCCCAWIPCGIRSGAIRGSRNLRTRIRSSRPGFVRRSAAPELLGEKKARRKVLRVRLLMEASLAISSHGRPPTTCQQPAHLSEEEYRLLWETSTDAVVILDHESTIRFANPAVADVFGYRPEEMIGEKISLVQPERLREPHRRGLARYLATGVKKLNWRAVEAAGLHRLGHEFPIEIAFSHLSHQQGDLFAAFIRDISDRRQAEEALRVGRVRMDLVLEGTDVGLWACPLPLSQLEWDARVKRHFWLGADAEVTLEVFFERLHPDDRERVRCEIETAVSSGNPFETEYRTISPGTGAEKWIRAIGRVFSDDAGNQIGFDGITIDITSRKNAEVEREALLASERAARTEAERVSRTKDEFLATLSHELRTPLNAIVGWSQILGSDGTPKPEDLAEGLKVIERNARVQAQLIEDLLDMSRIISGKVRLNVQPVDLSEVIVAAVAAVAPGAEAKGIRIQKVLEPLASPVMGDPSRLQQIVWNLLSNAIKFTPKEGRVQVIMKLVNSHLAIVVSDTGAGIKPEFLPHVFERFRQEDATTTRRYGGLGLGLAIVKHLAEMHGGDVRAASPGENQGATFSVHLPLAIAHQHEAKVAEGREHPRSPSGHPAECPPALDGAQILVVDDERDSRALVKRILEECDAIVTVASSAEEGFAALKRQKIDVIISDIGMPGMDGYQFIRAVRKLSEAEGGKSPAIALTAFARSEDRQRAMLAGFDMHIAKPVEPAELIAVVARLTRRV